jgi:DUF2911 family protein
MKRSVTTISSLALLVGLVGTAWAQRNPRGHAELTLNGKKVSVEYGRPSLGTRTAEGMLGQLRTGGKPWRLGADKSTTFSTEVDLDFGGVTVPTGEYSIWVRKGGGNAFQLVFNKQHGQWGTEYDPTQDLVSVPLKQEKEDKSSDQLTIGLESEASGGEITIHWGTLELAADFKAKG